MRTLLLILAVFVTTPVYAAPAVKIPALKLCASGDTVTAKQKCSKFETQLTLSGLKGKDGLNGANGSNGINGLPGGFSAANCIKREATASGVEYVISTSACLVNEMVLSSGCLIDGAAMLVDQTLLPGNNSNFGPNIYGLVRCTGFDIYGGGDLFSVTAQALCCKG